MSTFEIRHVRALVRRPQRDEAQQLLERIAAHVLPILTQRRFRVLQLQEFFPTNARLLGMNINRGAKIYIRLRPASQPASFLPFEALLETMLHELTHMVHGPHNQAFYKYLDELKAVMEALLVEGLIGAEGAKFASAGAGRVIDGTRTIAVRHSNDNNAAVLAAQRRAQYQYLVGLQPSQRLGTGIDSAGGAAATGSFVTQRELKRRMLAAAERRRRDHAGCVAADALTQSIEVLGIDDSDDDDGSGSGDRLASRDAMQQLSGGSAGASDSTTQPSVIDLTSDRPVSQLTSRRLAPAAMIAIDDDEDSGCASTIERTQRRPSAVETIDLTCDDDNDDSP